MWTTVGQSATRACITFDISLPILSLDSRSVLAPSLKVPSIGIDFVTVGRIDSKLCPATVTSIPTDKPQDSQVDLNNGKVVEPQLVQERLFEFFRLELLNSQMGSLHLHTQVLGESLSHLFRRETFTKTLNGFLVPLFRVAEGGNGPLAVLLRAKTDHLESVREWESHDDLVILSLLREEENIVKVPHGVHERVLDVGERLDVLGDYYQRQL